MCINSGLDLTPHNLNPACDPAGAPSTDGRRPRQAPKGPPPPVQLGPRDPHSHSHRLLGSCCRTPSSSEGVLGRVQKPRLPQSAREATCGNVPAKLSVAGGRRAGQLSKKSWPPGLRSPRTDRCGLRCPGRSAPSLACPCQSRAAASRLRSADSSSGCRATAPLPSKARPAQAPAHLPARHAPRQPRPLRELLGVTWGRAGQVGVKPAGVA